MPFLFSKNKKQLEAVFMWLSKTAGKDDLILVEQNGRQRFFYFEFPLRFGDKPRKAESPAEEKITFFINFSKRRPDFDEKKWVCIFHSSELEIYEKKERPAGAGFKPLRWGLGDKEKKIALDISRKSMEFFFEKKRIPSIQDIGFSLPLHFFSRTDIGIDIWVDGFLRGSWVARNRILSEGLIEASVSACRDPKFKPLEVKDLAGARIEITLISDLKIPLGRDALRKNEIYHDKGYLAKREDRVGYFLPAIFNVRPFENLSEFLFALAVKKAGLRNKDAFDGKTEFFVFEVDDFIEGATNGEVLSLDGPVVRLSKEEYDLEKIACQAADWLLKAQEPDGNFVPILDPITGRTTQIDWTRSALCAWSLAEFGQLKRGRAYLASAEKCFLYNKKYILDEKPIVKNYGDFIMALTFLGELALSLGYLDESSRCAGEIVKKELLSDTSPIVLTQAANFFLNFFAVDGDFIEPVINIAADLGQKFENNLRQGTPMSLPVWAGLAELFCKAAEITTEITKKEFYFKKMDLVADWLLRHQAKNGSFMAASNSGLAYTRGTAKILEVLSGILISKKKQIDGTGEMKYYKDCVCRGFFWLAQTQYSLDSAFFAPKKDLDFTLGGFRHDYFNPELWIDSAGHFLLAVSRYLNSEKYAQ